MSNSIKPVTSSLNQGAQFADMTKTMHGGSRKKLRKNKKMGSTQSRSRSNRKNNKSKKVKRQSGGGSFFTPYADYSTEFDQQLPADMRALSGVGPLDAKFVELPAIERAAGVMTGGGSKSANKKKRRSPVKRSSKKRTPSPKRAKGQRRRSGSNRKSGKQQGGSAPVDEPSMLLRTSAEEMDARLNPQWYTENTVIPNFRGPVPIPGGTVSAPLYPSTVPVPKVGGKRSDSRR